ncbi:lysozyme g-like isoform X3 [Rhinatrema bivittatum]|uniref:lysozyme g-like isoform X3 n=1 Tax=Rhinatrema bivittatum TaxID=194408 RepID=UPI00112B1B02|nr:lysozyme g-like isoform X3 [Rhinatrema bivittatum]
MQAKLGVPNLLLFYQMGEAPLPQEGSEITKIQGEEYFQPSHRGRRKGREKERRWTTSMAMKRKDRKIFLLILQEEVSKRSAVKMFIGLLILCFATIIHVSEELGLYGDIMKVSTTGASCVTAKQNKLDHCGINASEKLAKADLERINKYKKQIKEVARKLLINAAVIAGVISRESRAGAVLDKGWGENDNTFGLMQVE